jgi:hypothetical protein
MTEFMNLRVVTSDGISAPVDPHHPDSPYNNDSDAWNNSRIARIVTNSRVEEIGWEFNGRHVSVQLKYVVSVTLDPTSDLLIATTGDKKYSSPCNAIVINPDGTLNHQISPPKFVELSGGGKPTEYHAVESISDLYVDESQRIVIGLDFDYEWVERRYYDPAKRHWGERVLLYRR